MYYKKEWLQNPYRNEIIKTLEEESKLLSQKDNISLVERMRPLSELYYFCWQWINEDILKEKDGK